MFSISIILSRLLSFVPTTRIICFNSNPDYTDNAYGVFKYAIETHLNKKYKLIWIVNHKENILRVKCELQGMENACAVYKYSFKGIWSFIRCRYVFHTHGILGFLNLKQHTDKMINLWHGMPLKTIGLLDPYYKDNYMLFNTDVLIATSPIFQNILNQCFGVDNSKILITGQPRCDLLFDNATFWQTAGIDKNQYESVGIWLPTYRASNLELESRTDGNFQDGHICFMSVEDLKDLNLFLNKNRRLLIIKLHPMDKLQSYKFPNLSNIHIIKQKDFKDQLYPLLGECDYLLTDFSSVWIDYDITNKPMAFVMDDFSEYNNSRGFTIENLDNILPGPIIDSFTKMEGFILKPYRTEATLEFNTYKDNQSTFRLFAQLGIS